MSEEKIIEVFNKGLEEVMHTIINLSNQIKEQEAKIDQLIKENVFLNKRLKALEDSSKKTAKIVANHHLATSLRKRKLNH